MNPETEQAVLRSFTFSVDGTPKAQPRTRTHFKSRIIYTPNDANEWKAQVRAAAKKHITEPIDGPICLRAVFFFPRPASHYRTGKYAGTLRDNAPMFHIGKPDTDNLAKAVMDALMPKFKWKNRRRVCVDDYCVWTDDSKIAEMHIQKQHGQPGAIFVISTLHNEQALNNEEQK